MKAEIYRRKIEQDITQNYGILKQLMSKEEVNNLKYQQIMYIILVGNIEVSKICYFRNKKYGNEEPSRTTSALIKDALDIKKQIVGKAWRFQKALQRSKTMDVSKKQNSKVSTQPKQQISSQSPNKQQNQPQQDNKDKQKPKQASKSQNQLRQHRSKTVEQQKMKTKMKILQIQQLLTNLQAKLNTAKNEEQAAEYQKQYNKNFKELTFLRNKRRVQREQNIMKRISTQNSMFIVKKIDEIIKQINDIKQKNAKILDKLPKYEQKLSKSQQITRLNSIFKYYSKKQAQSSNRYFSDLQKEISKLKFQMFIKFAQEWKLNRIISIEEISSIFKSHSKGKRFITSNQFFEVLSDIHNLECIKEERPISNESLSQYFQEYILDDSKINKIVMNLHQPGTIDVAKYKFKPKSHSGKYLKDIEQQIQERKKTLQYLAGPKNNSKFNHLQKNKSRNNTAENSRLITNAQQGLQELYNPSVNFNDSVNSYSFRFKLKNTKNRLKTEGIIRSIQNTQQIINKRQSQEQLRSLDLKENDAVDRRHQRNKNKISQEQLLTYYEEAKEKQMAEIEKKKKKKQFEGFEDLIEESEEDEYLNKHLLPPIRQNRPANRIHF